MYEFPCVLCITVNGKEGCQANIDKWHNLLQDRASADECLGSPVRYAKFEYFNKEKE